MAPSRRTVLAVLLVLLSLVTAAFFRGLLGTIFFAITVAYVLVPVADRLEEGGLPPWWAAAGATTTAFLAGLAAFLPIAAVLYVRRAAALALLRSLP